MGGNSSKTYESKEQKVFETMAQTFASTVTKSKRDGTVLRSKQQIVDDYDSSNLPYPLKPILKLDYCWRLTYTMYKHSLYLSMPLTLIYHVWTQMPQCWKYTFKTAPYRKIGLQYITIVALVNAVNTLWSLSLEEYW